MNPLIGIGISLIPELLKLIAQDKAGADGSLAQKIIKTVTDVTGETDAPKAQAKVDADPKVATDLQVELAQIALDQHKIDADNQVAIDKDADLSSNANTSDARATLVKLLTENTAVAWTPSILSGIVVLGFFGIVVFLLITPPLIPTDKVSAFQLINICVGAIATGFATVMNFWLGSSLGSRRKDASAIAAQIQQTQPGPVPGKPIADTPAAASGSSGGVPNPVPPGGGVSTPSSKATNHAATSSGGLGQELAEARKYKAEIDAAATTHTLPAPLIYAIGSRESGWGIGADMRPHGPSGTGDWAKRNPATWGFAMPPDGLGWGRGLMQIDYQDEFAKTGGWRAPGENIDHGCKELTGNIAYFKQLGGGGSFDPERDGIAAYNCGRGNVHKAIEAGEDVDRYTTGHNYSADVKKREAWFGAQNL